MIRRLSTLAAVCLLSVAAPAMAQCTDQEFGQFQMYGLYQEANARIPDGQLSQLFAARIGLPKPAFKALYGRCLARWNARNAEEARSTLQRGKEAFAVDCRKRAAGDEICRAVLAKEGPT